MTIHAVTQQELDEWRGNHWVQFAARFGTDSAKSLELSFGHLYRVKDHGRIVYIGGNAETAIREYNALR